MNLYEIGFHTQFYKQFLCIYTKFNGVKMHKNHRYNM